MKHALVILALFVCVLNGLSQKSTSLHAGNSQGLKSMEYHFNKHDYHDSMAGEKREFRDDSTEHCVLKKCNSNLRVLDSTDYYIGSGNDWIFESRYKTLTIDKFGNILTGSTDFFDSEMNSWSKKYRIITTYSNQAEHLRNEYLRQVWDSVGKVWLNETHIKFFGENGYTEMLSKEWDFARNCFTGGYRYIYTINDENLASSRIAQKWDTLRNDWGNDVKNSYLYTVAGKPLEINREIWNRPLNIWINYRKDIFEYDSENNNIRQTILYWSGSGGWTNKYLLERYFNSDNLLTSAITKQWNNSSSIWEEIQRNDYSYTKSELLSENLIFRKNTLTNSFVFYQKISYQYDGRGNQLVYLDQMWDLETQAWFNVMQKIQKYSTKDKPTLVLQRNWNRISNAWINDFKERNTYMRNGFHVQYIKQIWDPESNQWNNLTRYDNYYSGIKDNMGNTGNPVISHSDEHNKIQICTIYPNPAKEKVTIKFHETDNFDISRIELYDYYGKLQKSINVKGDGDITIYRNGLKNGKYYLNFIGGERYSEIIIFN